MLTQSQRDAIIDAVGADEVRFDEPMSKHTTLRIGGPVDAWVTPRDVAALRRLRKICFELGIPSRGFGSGSNLLVRDGGIRGVAISLKHLTSILSPDERVIVDAGSSTGKLLDYSIRKDLGGVEFLGGVPGTVGGGMIMNAGTYLGEFKDVTQFVDSVDEKGELVRRDNTQCGFRYRHSDIPASEVVFQATLKLRPRPRAEIEADVKALRDRRKAREPHGVPNAGSIFKNPPNDYAGRLIEECGLKGRRAGGAEVSPAHANWIVNAGGATAKNVLELVEIVRAAVVERFGIRLELEVKVVGEE